MKSLFPLVLLLVFAFASCKEKDDIVDPPPVAPSAKVSVSFRNMIGSEAISTGQIRYTNANGDPYSVDLLKYYVSHLALIRADDSVITSPLHKLIDNSDTGTMRLSLGEVPNGKYVAVRFYLGVDSIHNHSGDQLGDLDPVNGMIWVWNTGYIFFKHEGSYKDKAGDPHSLIFHLGTDDALPTVTVPLSDFEIRGVDRELNLRLDLNRLYAGPPLIDFGTDNIRMSTSRDDELWKNVMRQNMSGAFQFVSAK